MSSKIHDIVNSAYNELHEDLITTDKHIDYFLRQFINVLISFNNRFEKSSIAEIEEAKAKIQANIPAFVMEYFIPGTYNQVIDTHSKHLDAPRRLHDKKIQDSKELVKILYYPDLIDYFKETLQQELGTTTFKWREKSKSKTLWLQPKSK